MDNASLRESLAARRAERLAKIEDRKVIMRDMLMADRIDLAHVEEITWALEALDMAPPQPAPAQVTKPVEPLDACVEAIRSTFIMPLNPEVTDRMVTGQLKDKGFNFRRPTVRKALEEINKESRASAQPPSDENRKDTGSPSDATPGVGGAGPDVIALADIPKFLDRREPKAEAAE